MKNSRLLMLALVFFSCSKDRKICYECDVTPSRVNVYTPVGCYTSDEWENAIQTDLSGMPIDKNSRCRIKQ